MKKYTLQFSSVFFVTGFLLAAGQAAWAFTLIFTNPAPITIPSVGTASPYPATINVNTIGLGPILDVNVTINGLTHTFINDVGALLVGPGGQSVVLFDGVGGNTGVSNLNLVFDDQSGPSLPSGAITSGTYKPTNLRPSDIFPSPAPSGPYGSLLSVFNNTNVNGTWRLFINDFATPNGGSIAGGFSLQISAADVPEPASFLLIALGLFPIAAWLRGSRAGR